MLSSLIETSRFVPESEAILALIAPDEHAQKLQSYGALSVVKVLDTWEGHNRNGLIFGYVGSNEKRYPIELNIHFAGLINRSMARALHRDPAASVSITIYEAIPPPCANYKVQNTGQ